MVRRKVGEKTLRAAQKEPEKYRDLLVRVAGYSAYFVTLNKETQEDIISRTTQMRLGEKSACVWGSSS